MFWVSIAVSIAFAVVGELLRPKQAVPNAKASSLDDFEMPTAEEGRKIPCFAGKLKITGPNVTWYGDLNVVPIKRKVKTGWFSSATQIINFKYHLGMQLVFAHGRDDMTLHTLNFGDKMPKHTRTNEADGVVRLDFDDTKFFGGDESEGGISGIVRFYPGNDTQPANAYFGSKIGEDAPAYRGLCHMILEGTYLGTSHYIKQMSAELSSYPNQLGLTDNRHKIVDDANPACMIYEILTDDVWAISLSASDIDVDAFRSVGNTLHAEGYGISMIYNGGTSGRQLIEELLRHVDGCVFPDPETGLVTIRLARNDYDPNTIPHFTQEDFTQDGIKFSRPSWSETKNRITASYTDRENDYATAPITHQDLANIIQRGGEIASEQIDYTGFSRYEPCAAALARTLKTLSYPLANLQGALTRKAWRLKPADVFKITWPDLGINGAIFRVVRIGSGTLENASMGIEAVEDIFSISDVAYVEPPPSGWTDPVGTMTPLVRQRITEAPAFNAPGPERFIITMGSQAASAALGYDTWAYESPSTTYEYRNFSESFTPSATLVSNYPVSRADEHEAGFTVQNFMHKELLDAGDADSRRNGLNLAIIGNEWFAWRNWIDNGDGTLTFQGVWSGVLDTVPQPHVSGDLVWFPTEGAGLLDDNGFTSDKTVSVKLLPKTIGSSVDIDDAVAMALTTVTRAARPLVPGKVRIGASRPVDIIGDVTGPLTLTWAHRSINDPMVRSQSEDSQVVNGESPNYNIRVYNNTTNTLVASALDKNGTSASIRVATDMALRIELEAVQAGVVSYQKHTMVLSYLHGAVSTNEVIVDEAVYILDGGGA